VRERIIDFLPEPWRVPTVVVDYLAEQRGITLPLRKATMVFWWSRPPVNRRM
jgi:hypothetical protein